MRRAAPAPAFRSRRTSAAVYRSAMPVTSADAAVATPHCAKSDKEGEPMMFRFVVAALIACAISNAHAAPPSVAAPAAVAATDSAALPGDPARSEEHTSELQSLMRISYAVFCLKKKKNASLHIVADCD